MNVAIVLGIILVILFVIAYLTKRRFGVLGLALAAGSMLSAMWAAQLAPLVHDAGLVIQSPPLITVVSVVLILLPAIVLLFSGPSYRGTQQRIIGAFLFAALALAFLVEPLGSAMVLMGDSRDVYEFIDTNRIYIITVGLVIALVDVLGTHTRRAPKESSKH